MELEKIFKLEVHICERQEAKEEEGGNSMRKYAGYCSLHLRVCPYEGVDYVNLCLRRPICTLVIH